MNDISEIDLAWLSGLFEGEGSMGLSRGGSASGLYFHLVIKMTDEDIVRRAHKISGVGQVGGPYLPKEEHHKPQWTWQVTKTENAKTLALAMYPYLGERRRAQIDKCLSGQYYASRPSQEERFWALVDTTPSCWYWKGSKGVNGHGQWGYSLTGKRQAHRYCYELLRGEVPPRLRNTCGSPHCVNPDHWERDVKHGLYVTATDVPS